MKICTGIFLLSLGFAVSKKFTAEEILIQEDIDCIKELGLNTDWVLDNVNDDVTLREGIPDMNNLLLCGYIKLNAYNKDTEMIVFKNLVKPLTKYANLVNGGMVNQEQLLENAFETCKTTKGSDPGDRIVKFNNCVMKNVAV